MLGLRFCARAFSSCGKQGPLLIAVRGPLTIVASPVAEHRPQTRRLSSRGSRAQSLRGMWDPPRSGLEPVSPALAGRLPTTAPPGKPQATLENKNPCLLSPSLHFLRVRCHSFLPWRAERKVRENKIIILLPFLSLKEWNRNAFLQTRSLEKKLPIPPYFF